MTFQNPFCLVNVFPEERQEKPLIWSKCSLIHWLDLVDQRSKSLWPNMFWASWTWYLKFVFRDFLQILTSCHLNSKINWLDFSGQRSKLPVVLGTAMPVCLPLCSRRKYLNNWGMDSNEMTARSKMDNLNMHTVTESVYSQNLEPRNALVSLCRSFYFEWRVACVEEPQGHVDVDGHNVLQRAFSHRRRSATDTAHCQHTHIWTEGE